ncbi:exonuclease domain-containing protein [Lentisalinibacter salinarum]|uniref:exonuclease domain-containing protein n=1 Tax=Lentisalinibacter salinarum TaxID=2992239 RepID=UPI003870D759
MNFVAIDVETANADLASICQVGIAKFANGELADEWFSYVDPQDHFDPMNVSIHGINTFTVQGSPSIADLYDTLDAYLGGSIAVCHTYFDRMAVEQAMSRFSLRPPIAAWLDSARVARRAWSQFARKGYGLANVCKTLGYTFRHHDALEDAKAAGYIILAAMEETGLDLDQWLVRVNQPIDPTAAPSEPVRRDGNPDGPLHGEILVFTGSLEIPRRHAADLAASVGCTVASGVTKNTTLLVVGDQDVTKLAGHRRSSKHRKALELVEKGQSIRIIRETDFKKLVDTA